MSPERRPTPAASFKRVVARLPSQWQLEMKRVLYGWQIRRGAFRTREPEYDIMPTLIGAGDWVVDVGANVGHYTKRMSDLVGPHGRVIAFEPVPETFSLLAANSSLFAARNVTLVNAAASDHAGTGGMSVPLFDTGHRNYYEAALTEENAELSVFLLPLDELPLPHRVRLVKIDAEGHDDAVLRGAEALLVRDRPTLIVETVTAVATALLDRLGYRRERLPGSPNTLCHPLPS
jgi:FkbM family methyltransferase